MPRLGNEEVACSIDHVAKKRYWGSHSARALTGFRTLLSSSKLTNRQKRPTEVGPFPLKFGFTLRDLNFHLME